MKVLKNKYDPEKPKKMLTKRDMMKSAEVFEKMKNCEVRIFKDVMD